MKKKSNAPELQQYLYISPKLLFVDPAEKQNEGTLKVYFPHKKYITEYDDIYGKEFTIVLSEPGNGKSRLLKEVVIHSKEYKINSIFLDLKKLGDNEIDEKLNEILKNNQPKLLKDNEEINATKDYFFCKAFKLTETTEDIIICLDALDEVKSEIIFDVIEKIKSFKGKFPKVKIVVSCRDNIFQKYKSLFDELNSAIFQIDPFDIIDVKNYLSAHKFTEDEINKVVERFWQNFQISIINSPRILEIFIKLKNKEGLGNVLNKSKAELLEHFIYSELYLYSQNLGKDISDLVSRVLEKLALTMSIYQTTIISKDELLTFFDDIDSSLSKTILSHITIDQFFEKTVLILNKENKIQFENKEFQEYLTAKEITRLGRIEQRTFDLIIDKDLREIFSFWCNPLKYLLELNPNLTWTIIEFICKKENPYSLGLIQYFIIDDNRSIKKIGEEKRNFIFNSIFLAHQINNYYLADRLAEKLSFYFTLDSESALEKYNNPETNAGIQIENTLLVANHLINPQLLSDTEPWSNLSLNVLKDLRSTNSTKRYAIRLLSKFKDITLLEKSFNYSIEPDSLVLNEFSNACQVADPNSDYTVDLVIYLTKDRRNMIPRPDFDEVTSASGINRFLAALVNDSTFYDQYIYYHSSDYFVSVIDKNIRKVYGPQIEQSLLSIITKSFHATSKFIDATVLILIDKCEDLMLKLLSIKNDKGKYTEFYRLEPILKKILTAKNTAQCIEAALKIGWNSEELSYFFAKYERSTDAENKRVFAISKKYFKQEYDKMTKYLKSQKISKSSPSREVQVYQRFKYLLEPEPKKYSVEVFSYYSHNKAVIDKFITTEVRNRMVDILTNTVIKNFDPTKATATITSSDGINKSYSLSTSVVIFGSSIPIFADFGIDIKKLRNQFLEYIPYSFGVEVTTAKIFELLGPLSKTEIEQFINFYKKPRKDDLIKITISNFFDVCKQFKIIEAVPILENIVQDKGFDNYYRVQALDLINELKPDIEFYKKIFKEGLTATTVADKNNLSEKANVYLIKNNNAEQGDAIKWRINLVLSNPIEYENPNNPEEINPYQVGNRIELSNSFMPLFELSDVKHKDLFNDLLARAIELYKINRKFRSYAAYLWSVVFNYYNKLVSLKSIDIIFELERMILANNGWDGFSYIKQEFYKVKTNYVNNVSKPDSYSDAIAIYNKLRTNRYVSISTPEELCFMVQNIIDVDIKNWVEKEGAYKFMVEKDHGPVINREELIQKTIKSQFELALMRRGMRENETTIRREEQLLDNKRTDFVISYGFVGQVLIELKLTLNKDIKDKTYVNKMVQYLDGTKSNYAIYLIFQVEDKHPWLSLEAEVRDNFKEQANRILIKGFDCTLINK